MPIASLTALQQTKLKTYAQKLSPQLQPPALIADVSPTFISCKRGRRLSLQLPPLDLPCSQWCST
eukprot:scaffold11808_cov111-Skeletonema_marinoi.AAC.1